MEEFVNEGYKAFEGMISKEEFVKHIQRLDGEEMRNFLRASLMYQRATKCRGCDSDVQIVLLCSSVEVVSSGKNVIFKDWLIHNSLGCLSNRDERDIEKALNKEYERYTSSEENREGISYNFRRFLLEYCPSELRNPPIIVYRGKGDRFEVAVRAIYSNFRSLYLHEGKGYASEADKPYVDKETGEPATILGIPLLLKSNGNILSIELTEITQWFGDVVKNSIFQYLVKAE